MQNPITKEKRIPVGRLTVGIVLLVLGIAGFADAIDLWEPSELLRFWPVALIVIGVASEADALRERRSGGGFILIAVGVWMLVATQHLFGLRFVSAMPLGVVIAGLGLVLHAIVDVPRKKENDHEPC